MGQVTIPVNLLNPGQVFGCLGLLEAADFLCGPAEGGFNWSGSPIFELYAENAKNPLEIILDFLASAKIATISPAISGLSDAYGIDTHSESSPVFPSPTPKASILPVELSDSSNHKIRLSHWSETNESAANLDNVKFWGGAAGYSAAARLQDLRAAFKQKYELNRAEVLGAPFDVSAKLSNGFRLEMRRDYVPIDVGFSPNNHSSMEIIGYPLVELLAAFGLQNARPKRIHRQEYRYGAWGQIVPPILARPALGCKEVGFSLKKYVMQLGKPNKFDRSILHTIEEANYE